MTESIIEYVEVVISKACSMYLSMYDACGIFGQMRQWQRNIIRIGGEGAEVVQLPSYGCTVAMGEGGGGGGGGGGGETQRMYNVVRDGSGITYLLYRCSRNCNNTVTRSRFSYKCT